MKSELARGFAEHFKKGKPPSPLSETAKAIGIHHATLAGYYRLGCPRDLSAARQWINDHNETLQLLREGRK